MRNRADIEGRDCAIISRLFARSSPVLVFLLGFLVLVQVQCDRKKPTAILAGRVGSVSIEVQIPTLSAPEDRSAKATIIQGLLQITGDGMAPMDTTLQVEDGWIRGGIGGVPEGQRTVSLTLQDSEGDTLWGASTDVVVEFRKTATAVLLIQRVGDEAPEVTVTVSPDIGKVDTVFVAQAGAIDRHDPTDSLRVRWDFDGDGSFEIPWTTRKQISHSYIQAGSFSVALEVVDRTGNIGRATHQVKVFDITARGGMRDGPDTLRTGLDETVIPLDGVGRIQPEGALIYHWSQILDQTGSHDRSIVGTFTDNNSQTANRISFKPELGRGTYVFTLYVEEETFGLRSEPDTVFVIVRGHRPVASIPDPPESIEIGQTASLQGQGADEDGDALLFRWRGESIALLSDTTSARAVFTPDQPGEYRFSFVAVDSELLESRPIEIMITVTAKPNAAPTADAGLDQTVTVGDVVQFDGSQSTDPEGHSLTFHWSQTSGQETELVNQDSAIPQFSPTAPGAYVFSLIVNDEQADSDPDEVVITVNEAPLPSVETLTVDLPGGATMEFVWIEPGRSTMGSPETEPGRAADESPQHDVTISRGFYLGKFEVTQEQWEAVMNTTPWWGQGLAQSNPNHPAVYVSWEDVQEYVQALNQAEGEAVYRLPTEAEWEYACRAGTTTRWSFGEDEGYLADYAWHSGNAGNAGERYAHQVGLKKSNLWGLHDMHGNVWEWCQDNWYRVYTTEAQVDPIGPVAGEKRVARGGSFIEAPLYLRSAGRRYDYLPNTRIYALGFRLAKMADSMALNHPPEADAGEDQTVEVGVRVQLDGSRSSDLDGDELDYRWVQVDGPSVELVDQDSATPQFLAVSPGIHIFSLIVNDGHENSDSELVVVTVNDAPPPSVEAINVDLPDGNILGMVWIEPGTFLMGSQTSDEDPQHQVTISRGFYLGKYEIAQAQWESVMGNNPSDFQGKDRPVEMISWNDAQAFVHQLNVTAGDSLYRLPTEGEWEYACRANTTSTWSFGDDQSGLGDYAWYSGNNASNETKRVGTKLPNPWGLYDMHGNVMEWCLDWHGPYSSNSQTDPMGPASGSNRVLRGGGFANVYYDTKSALRLRATPDYRRDYIGARLLRMAEPLSLNTPPTANAGADQIVEVGEAVTLDGSGSSDADGDVLTFQWTAPTGMVLDDTTSPTPNFLASSVGVYVLMLMVNDGQVNSTIDDVVITVNEAPLPSVETIVVDLPARQKMEFIWIEPGTFTMGSPPSEPGREENEGPQHEVTISTGYYLGRYEVTQGQWEAVMGNRPWETAEYVRPDPNNPAAQIQSTEIQTFPMRLNELGLSGHFRLPTEAEWEYACRAGTSTRWSFGDDESQLGKYAWYQKNAWDVGERYAHTVGSKLPNPWGLYDMHGNVDEMVRDWYGSYSSEDQIDPIGRLGSFDNPDYTIRGGRFDSPVQGTRSSVRSFMNENANSNYVGFRLVMGAIDATVETNDPPTAEAGPDQVADVGTTVELDGTDSSDPDGDDLSYYWAQTFGPATHIVFDHEEIASFSAEEPGTYRFVLTVTDGKHPDIQDEVVVTVTELVQEPIELMTANLPGGATMEFVWIEPGTFTMGASDWEPGHPDGPQHEVTISRGFYLGKYEITQEQWETVMGTRPYEKKDNDNRYWRDDPKHPAILISWFDVQAFIGRLNDAEGSEQYRLPTEAEWEYACRAGTTTMWSFGNDESLVGDYAWFRENTFGVDPQETYAHEVGTKLPNPWGLHDMYGNVWEWTGDWYFDSYPEHSQLDPTGPKFGTSRVLRGGAYDRPPGDLRSAFRRSLQPDMGGHQALRTGARLVKYMPGD